MGIVFCVFFFAITSLPILRQALGHLGHGSQTSLECVTLQRLWVGCSAPTLSEICIVQVFPLSPEEKLRPSSLLTPQCQFLLLAAIVGTRDLPPTVKVSSKPVGVTLKQKRKKSFLN